jgi:chemotaxis protein CheD
MKALPGFEHIARIWDQHHKIWLAKIHPGDTCVTASTEGVTTVIGSCVAACIRDIRTGVGGMNHFLSGDVDAMERLLDAVLAHGSGERSRLELKLVGGCCPKPDWPGTGQLQIRKLRGVQALLAQREQEYGRSLAE